jgi:hypothetical protein
MQSDQLFPWRLKTGTDASDGSLCRQALARSTRTGGERLKFDETRGDRVEGHGRPPSNGRTRLRLREAAGGVSDGRAPLMSRESAAREAGDHGCSDALFELAGNDAGRLKDLSLNVFQ